MTRKNKSSRNYMDIKFYPETSLHWVEGEDNRIIIAMENRGFFHWIARIFFHRPRISHISLDIYGSTLWHCLDGEHSVYDLVNYMKACFPRESQQMTCRVVSFLQILQTNHFITEKQ